MTRLAWGSLSGHSLAGFVAPMMAGFCAGGVGQNGCTVWGGTTETAPSPPVCVTSATGRSALGVKSFVLLSRCPSGCPLFFSAADRTDFLARVSVCTMKTLECCQNSPVVAVRICTNRTRSPRSTLSSPGQG